MPRSASVARWKHGLACALGSPWGLLREVDQNGGSGVDQGGSAVNLGHILVPGLRKSLKSVGEPRMAQLPAAGTTCPFMKLKTQKPCVPGAPDAGTLDGGVVAF